MTELCLLYPAVSHGRRDKSLTLLRWLSCFWRLNNTVQSRSGYRVLGNNYSCCKVSVLGDLFILTRLRCMPTGVLGHIYISPYPFYIREYYRLFMRRLWWHLRRLGNSIHRITTKLCQWLQVRTNFSFFFSRASWVHIDQECYQRQKTKVLCNLCRVIPLN